MVVTNDEFVSLIRARLKETNLSTYSAAVQAGLPQDAIRSILNGHTPKLDRAAKVCAALGLEFYIGPPREPAPQSIPGQGQEVGLRAPGGYEAPVWARNLLGAIDRLTDAVSGKERDAASDQVRIRELNIWSGVEWQSTDEQVVGYVTFSKAWLEQQKINPGSAVVITVLGDAMAPTIPNGSKALLVFSLRRRRDRSVYALWTRGKLLIRRLRQAPGDEWTMTCDNPREADEPLPLPADHLLIGEIKWVGSAI